jgi:hypothetical protein
MSQGEMSTLEQIEQMFHEALAIPAGNERLQWLAGSCRDDRELYREVASLLTHHDLATAQVAPEAGVAV